MTLCFALFFSCKHDPELTTGTPTICFESKIYPIITNYCSTIGCHDGNGEAFPLLKHSEILNKVEAFKPLNSPLYKAITANPLFASFMPPKGHDQLTSTQIDQIEIWILQGIIDDTACAPTLKCFVDTVANTFSKRILPINNFYCTGCHSGTSPGGGILLIDYTTIKNAVEQNNYLDAIYHTGKYPMPKSDPTKPKFLPDCHIKDIEAWINAKMPNN